ncbi:hypothetical protein SteCoe_9636 [Stentor coeruleus]|uniref:Uncharacterized protein n=1 Tax=Stentor coeruleus TaxID=5963 RepID=A0A1R2CHD5_9CILI|nr:hypothetical protein SteCoe_9636 [Stentor coeruleus]
MSQTANQNKFYINLPETKEISYADLLDSRYKDQGLSSDDFESEYSSVSYRGFLDEIIKRGDTLGYCTKKYTFQSDDETETQSNLSSFIDSESKSTSLDSEDFSVAINEGFYVLQAKDYSNKNKLKRVRSSYGTSCSELDDKINSLRELYLKHKAKTIPKQATLILKDISDYLDQNSQYNKAKIFQELSKLMNFSVAYLEKHIVQFFESNKKKEAYNVYNKSKRSFCKMIKIAGSWTESLEKAYRNLIEDLKKFVELYNEFVGKYEHSSCILDFKEEKAKIEKDIELAGILRSGSSSQPIELN